MFLPLKNSESNTLQVGGLACKLSSQGRGQVLSQVPNEIKGAEVGGGSEHSTCSASRVARRLASLARTHPENMKKNKDPLMYGVHPFWVDCQEQKNRMIFTQFLTETPIFS